MLGRKGIHGALALLSRVWKSSLRRKASSRLRLFQTRVPRDNSAEAEDAIDIDAAGVDATGTASFEANAWLKLMFSFSVISRACDGVCDRRL